MQEFKYLKGYPEELTNQVQELVDEKQLGDFLLKKYPEPHSIRSDKALYQYTMMIKNEYLQKSQPLSKVIYDSKIKLSERALGLHTFVSRVQGKKLKASSDIKISSIFKGGPEQFLRMIVVHELAHLKEKEHNKGFYKLCNYMEPNYHQIEFDTRLYLTHLDLLGDLYKTEKL